MELPSKNELRSKMDMKSSTLEDRVQVLDARDLLLQIGKVSIKNAEGNFLGTCPDMCPEKERYHRKMTNDIVKPYEVDENDTESLNLCIKRYNRSAADKEVELSHELRPPAVLQFTMNHILNCIIPRGEENPDNLPNWYLFVWDRTRAIRKDISVQGLYDDVSVAVVEKIARFHIHCAFRLCQLEAIHFDQRMNSENLTKSVRTLREMYKKRRERGMVSQNETEFHAYHLILKLGNPIDFNSGLCDCEQILHSQPIQFVMDIWRSLRMFSYVKFFRLVKYEATYLQAALLQRYFTSLRWRSLKMIQRTTPRIMRASYPLDDFREALCFEPDELEEFLVCSGSGIEDDNIVLNEVAESMEVLPTPYLSTVISYKLKTSIEEVINGGELQEDLCLYHVPHDSFDEQGYLKQQARRGQDQGLTPDQLQKIRANKSEGEASQSSEDEEVFKVRKRPLAKTLRSPVATRTNSPMRERLGRKSLEVRVPGLIKEAPSLVFKKKPDIKVASFAAIPKPVEKKPLIQATTFQAIAPQLQFTPEVTNPVLPSVAPSQSLPSVFQTWKAAPKPTVVPVVEPVRPTQPPPRFIPQPQAAPRFVASASTPVSVEEVKVPVKMESVSDEEDELDKELDNFLRLLYESIPDVADQMVSETVARLVRGIAYEFNERVVLPVKQVSRKAHAEILAEVVKEELRVMLQDEINIETDIKVARFRHHLLGFRTVLQWRKYARRRRQRRTSMENYPAYASFLSLDDQIRRVTNSQRGHESFPNEILEIQRKTDLGLAKVYCINDIERKVKKSSLDVPLIIGESLLSRRDELLRNPTKKNVVLIKSEISFKLAVIIIEKSRSSHGTYLKHKLSLNSDIDDKGCYVTSSQVDSHHRTTVSVEFHHANSALLFDDMTHADAIMIATDRANLSKLESRLEGLNVAILLEDKTNGSSGNLFRLSFKEGDVSALLELRRCLQYLAVRSADSHPDIVRLDLPSLNVFQSEEEEPDSLEQSIISGSFIVPVMKPRLVSKGSKRRKRVVAELDHYVDPFLTFEPPERRVKLDALRKDFSLDVADVTVNIRSEMTKEKEFEAYLKILLEEHELS